MSFLSRWLTLQSFQTIQFSFLSNWTFGSNITSSIRTNRQRCSRDRWQTPGKFVKTGFHMIATIAAIAGKTFSNRCDHMDTTLQRSHRSQHFTTIAEEWFANDRNGDYWTFFPAIVAIVWKPALSVSNETHFLIDITLQVHSNALHLYGSYESIINDILEADSKHCKICNRL